MSWNHALKDWGKVPTDSYKFVYQESSKRLETEVADSEKITSRAYSLLGIIAPLLAASTGIILLNAFAADVPLLLFLLSVIGTVTLSISLVANICLIGVRKVWNGGIEPLLLMQSEFMKSGTLTADENVKYLYMVSAVHNQESITQNKEANRRRTQMFFSKPLVRGDRFNAGGRANRVVHYLVGRGGSVVTGGGAGGSCLTDGEGCGSGSLGTSLLFSYMRRNRRP